MTCQIPEQLLKETIGFHGHNCPGLSIGIRAAEYALRHFNEQEQKTLICVTETDMCGVDGIQYLTQCTFGKGNLIHRDYGKAAFSFYCPETNRAIRLLLRPEARSTGEGEGGSREEHIDSLMTRELDELFRCEKIIGRPPRGARVLESLDCADCGEQTMESRTRRYCGKTLCIPCFNAVEQKV